MTIQYLRRAAIAAFFLLVATAGPETAAAMPTTIVVHAVAHDAKIIGTHVGGARITVRDAEDGRVLATGVQLGETGDTKKIMKEPRTRGEAVYDTAGAAGFVATIDVDRPTAVEITAEGPLGHPDSIQRASKTLVVIPGHDIGGDGVVLELHGLILDLNEPAGGRVPAGEIPVRLTLTMLCGCPIESGGMWNADDMSVTARLLTRRGVAQEIPVKYAGTKNTFAGVFTAVPHGRYTLEIVASDAKDANAGVLRKRVRVD